MEMGLGKSRSHAVINKENVWKPFTLGSEPVTSY